MTTPMRPPRAVAQIAREALRELGYGDLTYDFEMVLGALAREGWLAEPGELDAARAEIERLRAALDAGRAEIASGPPRCCEESTSEGCDNCDGPALDAAPTRKD